MKVNRSNIRWHEEEHALNTFISWQKVPAQAIADSTTANIITELNTADVNSTELTQQTYADLLDSAECIISEAIANLNGIPLAPYHSNERRNPAPPPTQDDITSPLINSSLLQTNTNPLSDTTEIITDDDIDCNYEFVRVLASDIDKWKILDMVDILNEHIRWRELSFNKISPYLHNINSTPGKYQYKYDPSIDCLKKSVTNAMIKYFSTKEESDTTMKCFNYAGCEYLDSSKLTDDNIKAFSNEVNNMIASCQIVLAALKLSEISDRKNSKKVIEYLCPTLSKLDDEYLEAHTRKLIEKLRLLLSNNITFWSKWYKDFKISSKKLDYILKEITPCESKKSDVFPTRKNHKPYSSLPHFKPKDSKEDKTNSCKDKKYHHSISKDDISEPSNPNIQWTQEYCSKLLDLPIPNPNLDFSEQDSSVLGEYLEALNHSQPY